MNTNEPLYESQTIAAPSGFSEICSHFYSAENKTAQTVHRTLVPHFQTILAFSFGADILLCSHNGNSLPVSRCILLGPVKQALTYAMPPGAELLVVNFKDDAFYRFFGQAMLFGNQPVEPDNLVGEDCFTNLWQSLKHINKNERVNHILQFCRPYLKERNDLLHQITATSAKPSPLNPVKIVARNSGRSERSVQMHFKKYLGYSAKEIARYQRFLQATEMIQAYAASNTRADWFEIIAQCGYYDQSQLIHDFKNYMHITPAQFLKFQEDICMAGQA